MICIQFAMSVGLKKESLKRADSSIFSITVKSQKTHFLYMDSKKQWPSSIKMGIPVHGNYNEYVWIGMARMEMASNLKTSGRIFQVSALVSRFKSLKTNLGLFLF